MKVVKYSWKQIEGAALDIARQLHQDNWKPDYIVGITRGGLIPANLLSQYLGVKMLTLHVSLRDHPDDNEHNAWMASDALGITDNELSSSGLAKNILIVDDINDSGATLNWIKEDWQSLCLPNDIRWKTNVWHKNVRFATIFDNAASNAHVDYCAEEFDKRDDPIWIDFPWENYWKYKLC